jgi:selenocysteine lyase/cysteine desulfurase
MPVAEQYVYLDHAAISPLPRPTRDAMAFWADDAMLAGVAHWKWWQSRITAARQLVAQLIGSQSSEVAFTSSTTAGVTFVAEGLNWQPGDSVVVAATEFPSNLFPWVNLQQRGVDVRVVSLPADDGDSGCVYNRLAEACDSTTRLVACSWVDFRFGRRNDVQRLAQIAGDCGAMLLVDAIQGLGVFPLGVEEAGIDFLVADGRKWLLGPDAAAIMYIRQSRLDAVRVSGPSWNSVVNSLDFDAAELVLKPDASRFETAITNTAGIAGLYASLKLLEAISLADRQQQVLHIRQLFVEAGLRCGLETRPMPVAEQSGIISFEAPGHDVNLICRSLRHAGVLASVRGGRLRVSPHLYNTQDDANQFEVAVLDAMKL